MHMWSAAKTLLASVIIIAVAVLVAVVAQNRQQEMAGTTMKGLPPFVNPDFDVLLNQSVVTIPAGGGSVGLRITLKATKLASSEALVLETHANIPRYAAEFNPTSVTLDPGDMTSIELKVIIPSGVQNGTYPMSIVARGRTTQGGSWILIVVGPPQPIPPS